MATLSRARNSQYTLNALNPDVWQNEGLDESTPVFGERFCLTLTFHKHAELFLIDTEDSEKWFNLQKEMENREMLRRPQDDFHTNDATGHEINTR